MIKLSFMCFLMADTRTIIYNRIITESTHTFASAREHASRIGGMVPRKQRCLFCTLVKLSPSNAILTQTRGFGKPTTQCCR